MKKDVTIKELEKKYSSSDDGGFTEYILSVLYKGHLLFRKVVMKKSAMIKIGSKVKNENDSQLALNRWLEYYVFNYSDLNILQKTRLLFIKRKSPEKLDLPKELIIKEIKIKKFRRTVIREII